MTPLNLSPRTARLVAAFAKYDATPLTAAAITDIVAARYGVSVAELKGPARHRYICLARSELMARLVESGRSMPWVGKYLGGRDHTTVLYGVNRYRARRSDDTQEAA